MKYVQLYTDGCSLGNPGQSGAGAVLVYKEHVREISKPLGQSTNNIAEIMAVVIGLEALNEPCKVDVYTDSQYVQKIAMGVNNASSNQNYWTLYWSAAARHEVELFWIRKDSHQYNKLAHNLANQAALMAA